MFVDKNMPLILSDCFETMEIRGIKVKESQDNICSFVYVSIIYLVITFYNDGHLNG